MKGSGSVHIIRILEAQKIKNPDQAPDPDPELCFNVKRDGVQAGGVELLERLTKELPESLQRNTYSIHNVMVCRREGWSSWSG
jgi:hypothetical protein